MLFVIVLIISNNGLSCSVVVVDVDVVIVVPTFAPNTVTTTLSSYQSLSHIDVVQSSKNNKDDK